MSPFLVINQVFKGARISRRSFSPWLISYQVVVNSLSSGDHLLQLAVLSVSVC